MTGATVAAARASERPLRSAPRGGEKAPVSEPRTIQDLQPGVPDRAGREMLAPTVKIALLAAVIACHVGVGWALTQASTTRLVVGDVAPMEVRMVAGEPLTVTASAGTVALDGERELAFEPGQSVRMTLRENAFSTVDVARCMTVAAEQGLLQAVVRPSDPPSHP